MFKQTFDLFTEEEIWITAVQVATVWTKPTSPRTPKDLNGTTNPTNIDAWIKEMSQEDQLALCNENRVQTQTLYGEPVIVKEITEGFAKVIVPTQPSSKNKQGYPGWIPVQQLRKVNKENLVKSKMAMIHKKHASLLTGDKQPVMKLSYLTLLPVIETHLDEVEVFTPHGNRFLKKEDVSLLSADAGITERNGEGIVEVAASFKALAYFWGGMSAFGYDCSGLAYAAHKANGYQIPRDASDQARQGKEVSFEELTIGDLLFFADEEGKGRIHHVGIYSGNGEMIHAPQVGKGVEKRKLAGTKYEKELCAARRYWK